MLKIKHKKWLSMLLAVVMIFSSMSSVVAYAADDATETPAVEVDVSTENESQGDEALEPTLEINSDNVLTDEEMSKALSQLQESSEVEPASQSEDVEKTETSEEVIDETTSEETAEVTEEATEKVDESTEVVEQSEEQSEEKTEDVVEPTDEKVEETEPVESSSDDEVQSEEPIDLENMDPDKVTVLPFEFEIVDDDSVNMDPQKKLFKASLLRGANDSNTYGDMAIKGAWDTTVSSFVWNSIPGYQTDNVRTFSLVDANGTSHMAFCIDSNRASGVGNTATYAGTYSGIGAKALYAIYRNVGSQSFSITIPAVNYTARNGDLINVPASYETVTIPKNDVILALRWLAWTNNIDSNGNGSYDGGITPSSSNAAWNDFYNLANAAGTVWPSLYFNVTRYQYEYFRNGQPWTPSASERDRYPLVEVISWISSEAQNASAIGGGSGGPMVLVDADTDAKVAIRRMAGRAITPANYTDIMAGAEYAESRASYASMVDSIVRQMYTKIYNVANSQSNVAGTMWSSGSREQRFVTFEYIPQVVKLQVTKVSSNPTVSDDNAMYKLEGLKYEIIVDGQSYGYVTLDANGVSNEFEFPVPGDVVGKTAILKEVDDATRKKSGYAVGSSGTITLANGLNTINVSDPPITDPPALKLQKVDAETGESYDKLGI